ncbi:rod shape-determining protein MreC [Candidatus Parcubacteria bacterium]|nr:rod shape-determining protein MreC [Candidatus Parcubacteria bacterium]
MRTRIFSKKNRIAVIFIIVLFFSLLNIFQKEVKNFCYLLFSPAQKVVWDAGSKTAGFWETISEIKTLKEDKEELKRQNLELLSENIKLRETKAENEFLRGALNLGLEKDFQLVLAQITAKDISQDSILINRGSQDGISEGNPVITQEKILLGKVREVYKNFSKIELLSNKESSFNVRLYNDEEDDVVGIIKGQGSFRLLLDLVPREKEIRQRDVLVTTAFGGIFPKGLLVGKVKEVKKNDVDPFQKVDIEPFFNIEKIENLFVISEND